MLILDGIEFEGFELPERLSFGGSQQIVTHKVVGGKRVVDAMGPDDDDLSWSGRFLGETAEMRAFLLDLLRRSGREVEVSCGPRAYRVVVSKFTATMERPYLFSYEITLSIVEDLVAGDGGEKSATLEEQIEADLAAAEAAATARDEVLAMVSLASTVVRAAMGDPQARHGLGTLLVAEAQGAVGDAIMAANGDAVAANLAVAAVGGVGGVIAGGDPAAMALGFLGTAASVEAAHAAGIAAASMTRVQTNMGAAVG